MLFFQKALISRQNKALTPNLTSNVPKFEPFEQKANFDNFGEFMVKVNKPTRGDEFVQV